MTDGPNFTTWLRTAPPECLTRFAAEVRARLEELDVCEHGVRCGDWCPECNAEYKRARAALRAERGDSRRED